MTIAPLPQELQDILQRRAKAMQEEVDAYYKTANPNWGIYPGMVARVHILRAFNAALEITTDDYKKDKEQS